MPESVTFSGLNMGTKTASKQSWQVMEGEARVWEASASITTASVSETITAFLSDGGDSTTVEYIRLNSPPEVTSFEFVNYSNGTIYPDGIGTWNAQSVSAQTAFRTGQTIKVSGTCEAHANTIEFTSVSSSLNSTQSLTVTAGVFSGNLTVGTNTYDTTSYFKMKCKETGGQYGPEITSNSQDGYIIKNNRAATFSTPSYTYDNGTALRKTEDCTVQCTVSTTYTPLYRYTCEEGTDVDVQGEINYSSTKT